MLAALLLWVLSAAAAILPTTPATRAWSMADAPTALIARAISVERPTAVTRGPTLDRRVPQSRGASGALAHSIYAYASPTYVRAALLQRPSVHVPHALRRTYDAHAPPGAIDRV